MAWWNFRAIMQGKSEHDSLGSTYLTISKSITNENISLSPAFTEEEIRALGKAPQVQDIGMLIPAGFSAFISIGGAYGFSTLLPLESAPDRFLDQESTDWRWQEGMAEVPVILSTEFLNQYNFVFAPSQGLPRLSEDAIRSLSFRMEIGSGADREQFLVRVSGFSDRITSVLAPEAFILYGNARHGGGAQVMPSRLILRTGDPSDPAFVRFLEAHHYVANAEQLRWNKLRSVVSLVSLSTAALALFLTGISALVFMLFIELTLARSRDNMLLLLQIGYSQKTISRFIYRRFVPRMLSAVATALIPAMLAQILFRHYMKQQGITAGVLPPWPVWLALVLGALLLTGWIRRTTRAAG